MTTITAPYQQAAGYGAEQLMLIELRVMNVMFQQLLSGQEATQIAQLRNDEAVTLGLPTPIPSP